MTDEMAGNSARWRTSSYSGGGNQCVQVAVLDTGEVVVRDSKNPSEGIHRFTPAQWEAFTSVLKDRS